MHKEVVVHIYNGIFSSIQFSHSVVSNSLRPHEPQHARPPCPSPAPRDYLNPCPLSRWCHPTISSSVVQLSSVQTLNRLWLFATPWTTAWQVSLSITNSQSPPKPMSIESVMPSNHLILCSSLLLLPSIFPSIRAFSNESALCIRWPKYWSFSFSISPSNEHLGLISFRMDWVDLFAV